MTLSPKLGVVGISTLWHFRLPMPIQMFIKVASSPRLSGIGMPSPILWSHPLKMQRIVLLSSLLWWELGTNSLITGPGEWLSFQRFASKLSWSWSWWHTLRSDWLLPIIIYNFMPRNPYHYNDTAAKLPGYVSYVAMATLCAAELLTVVLCYRYFLACWNCLRKTETPPVKKKK